MYYLPIILIFALSYFIARNSNGKWLMLLKMINITIIGTFIYGMLLGLYFKAYSMQYFAGEFPSVGITIWSSYLCV